jgi:hypothetical protein
VGGGLGCGSMLDVLRSGLMLSCSGLCLASWDIGGLRGFAHEGAGELVKLGFKDLNLRV